MQYTHFAARHSCCAEYCQPELLARHCLRTREGEQNASRFDFVECLGIEFLVSYKGILQSAFVLGKCRGVEDDEVVGVGWHIVEILECIFGKCLVTIVAREIQFHIVSGELDCLR